MKRFPLIPVFLFLAACSGGSSVRTGVNIPDKLFKDKLIGTAKRLYARELTSGTGGDISVRVPGTDRIIIKATKTCFGDLDYDKLSTMSLDGEVLEGNPEPSDEWEIHTAVYRMRDSVGAIMHMHSPYATAWATVGEKIPAVTQQSVSVLKDLEIIPYYRVGSLELTEEVNGAYRNPGTTVVMMENHGTFVVGRDLDDLLYKSEVVENTARIAWLCKALGQPKEFGF